MVNRKTAQSKDKLSRRIEQMIAAYIDLVLIGRPERTKAAARVGIRMIAEKARGGAR